MKKYIPLLLITSLILSACSIDWGKKKDCGELKEKMTSDMRNFVKKDNLGQDIGKDIENGIIRLYLRDNFYSKKENSCLFGFSEARDRLTTSGEAYIGVKFYIVDYLTSQLVYSSGEDYCSDNEKCEKEYSQKINELKSE